MLAGLWRNKGILLLAVALLVLFCCWFAGTQQYVGFDTSYYIGTIDTTTMTDTMYVYNGESNVIEETLDIEQLLKQEKAETRRLQMPDIKLYLDQMKKGK